MLQKTSSLVDEIVSVPIFVNTDLAEDWAQVVCLHLLRSKQSLAAVRLILADRLYAPAIVVSRYLFELAVSIRYLDKDVEARVPCYLEHNRCPSSADETAEIGQQIQQLRAQGNYVAISKLLVAGNSWQKMKAMCEELECLDHYYTMYRSASELAHSGAHGIALELMDLSGRQQRPDFELSKVLLTALIYYGWVVEISCKVFPDLKERFPFDGIWGDNIKILQDQVLEDARNWAGKCRLSRGIWAVKPM